LAAATDREPGALSVPAGEVDNPDRRRAEAAETLVRGYVLHGVCGEQFGWDIGPSDVCVLPKGHEGQHDHEDGVFRRLSAVAYPPEVGAEPPDFTVPGDDLGY
jgi:hypothetical protein